MKLTLFPALTALIILLSGCASQPYDTRPEDNSADNTIIEQVPTEKKSVGGASPTLIYNTLASEIAAQRGESDLAFDYAYKAALETRSPTSAERATSLGLQANRPQQALKGAQLWVEIAPNSLKAHQISAILNTRLQNLPATIRHLQRVVDIANNNGQSGYLQAAAISEKAASAPQALAIMQQLIPTESNNPDALYALALTASRAKQMNLALEYVDRSLRLDPKATNALILKAHALIASNKREEGIEFLAEAVKTFPDNTTLRNAYARTLVDLNDTERALAQYQILYEQQPENPDTLYALGILSLQLERLEDAKGHLTKLVDRRQRNNEASYYLGVISEEQKAWENALDWYSRVEGDKQADAQVRIAKILADSGSLDEAREILQRLRVNQSHHHLKFYLIEAELLREHQEYDAAHEVYTKAMELFEDNTELLYARGLNAADMNRVDLLERDLRKILTTQPDHADALNALGYTLADKTDRLAEAKGYIERANAMKPNNPAILDSLGWVEFRMGNLQKALDYLEQAAALSQDAEIASHLGEVLWQLGQRDQARSVWKAATDREPDNRFILPVMQRLGVEN
ncbi:MAG: tetratricopeptide repeat protein [Candidatus Thiodiazotropha sp. (ex Monitilora ramsayi)]|nr:tetratricopeptide repeat protein [Candidatus Thiodiazotropha sp. (ex Monitilora ramsayi)]